MASLATSSFEIIKKFQHFPLVQHIVRTKEIFVTQISFIFVVCENILEVLDLLSQDLEFVSTQLFFATKKLSLLNQPPGAKD